MAYSPKAFTFALKKIRRQLLIYPTTDKLSTMKKSLCVIAILIIDLLTVYAQNSCYSRLRGDTLIIGNHQIERTFIWNNGNLITYSLTNKATGKCLKSVSNHAGFQDHGRDFSRIVWFLPKQNSKGGWHSSRLPKRYGFV
jgi:hypothetical protein